MPVVDESGKLIGTQGWRQLLTCKTELLDAFDRARQHSRAHEIETYHGIVAEAQFRNWLSEFLPKRYGVTAGYIVSQGRSERDKLPAFDIIIYDLLEAPVLWIESHPDVSPLGKMRAIPAEHVKAVLEVKAVWNAANAKRAIDHLADLCPLLEGLDRPGERYPEFLPVNFTSWVVFFDLAMKDHRSMAAIDSLLPEKLLRGYLGGIVLRGETLPQERTCHIKLARMANPESAQTPVNKHQVNRLEWSLLSGASFSEPKQMQDGNHYQMFASWSPGHFASFAFELIAHLSGRWDRLIPTFHGFPGQEV